MRTRTAMHYNPSSLQNHNNNNNDDNDDDVDDHILWRQKKANEFIKQQQQHGTFIRHSTGGNNSGILYKHPSAIAMMTLNKRASQGDMPKGRGRELILAENNVLVGNELLTARKRHLRDLFSGDLGLPPVPPPPPLPLNPSHASGQRTHVGNVVHTFETLAMQRRLAAFKQHEQQQFRSKKQQQQQTNSENSTFSKYLKINKRYTEQKPNYSETTITNNNFSTHIKYSNNNNNTTTFNERNKQISQQFLQQMEIDYRKHLFSNKSHVNNINDNISEGEAVVVAKLDEMLAGYSTTIEDNDCDDNDDNNEAKNNVLHINLSSTNGIETDKSTAIKQLKCSNTNQGLLPIMRKKAIAPLPPPKPQTKTTSATSTSTSTIMLKHESCNNMLSQQHNHNHNQVKSNEFLRGSTLSQSFVCQSNWQHRKKARAPKPPILPITTSVVKNITKNKQIKTNTQLCIAITNPFRHVLRLNSKSADSFNLLQNVN